MYYDSEAISVETLKDILAQGYLNPNQAQGIEYPYAEHSLAELFSQVNQNPAGGEENISGFVKVQKETIAAQILASAQGFGADAMESRYGFDIIDTIANAARRRPHP